MTEKKEKYLKKHMNDRYLTTLEVIDKFSSSRITIFGCGSQDGLMLYNALQSSSVIVTAFIDNYKKGNFYQKIPIIGLENYDEGMGSIVIASNRFAMTMAKQIERSQKKYKYFIWDEANIYHTNKDIEEYIKFNKGIFRRERKKREKKIIVDWVSRHNIYISMLGCVSNYWASQFDAEILGYMDNNISFGSISEVMKDIYSSLNVSRFIEVKLENEQREEVERKYNEIIAGITTWEDVDRIKVLDVDFGTDFLRSFLRWDIPDFSITNDAFLGRVYQAVETVIFWNDYYEKHDVKMVVILDATQRQSLFRDITIKKGIPVYAIGSESFKATLGYYRGKPYEYFKSFWNQLSAEEKQYGTTWAKERLQKHISGDLSDVRPENRRGFTFAVENSNSRVLEENDKLKLLICPHVFDEESYQCGRQIFDNNYFSWLCHLGELSERTPEYDWYLKMHPTAHERDEIIIDKIIKKYPLIKKLPANISPKQLRQEGIKYALTVWGSIGHEYPMVGINVIHAGKNPHSAFHFTINPESKEEYDRIIFNLENFDFQPNLEELYQFYCVMFLFYDWNYASFRRDFFKNQELRMSAPELRAIGKDCGTWQYREYMKEWTQEHHQKLLNNMEDFFKRLDEWRPDVFYKRKVDITQPIG